MTVKLTTNGKREVSVNTVQVFKRFPNTIFRGRGNAPFEPLAITEEEVFALMGHEIGYLEEDGADFVEAKVHFVASSDGLKDLMADNKVAVEAVYEFVYGR